jgi:hypothetical protein
MAYRNLLLVLILTTAGCTRVVRIDATMPALVPGLSGVKTVSVGAFLADGGTPKRLGGAVAAMFRDELATSGRYVLADAPGRADLVLSGRVTCVIADATVTRHAEDVKTRTARVAVTLTGATGKTRKLFAITDVPTIEDKRRITGSLPEADQLANLLLRSCVRRLTADISPRRVRVKIPRPILSGSPRTRAGIDLLAASAPHPARAIEELTEALDRDNKDAAALNALGFCSERAGDLERARSGYLYAAAIDDRSEYRENMQRVQALIDRRRRIAGGETAPKGRPK